MSPISANSHDEFGSSSSKIVRMIEFEERQRLLAAAKTALRSNDANKAMHLLEPYVDVHKGDWEARAMLGDAYLRLGMFYNAESQFEESLAIHSGQYQLKSTLCRMKMDVRKWEEALELAQTLVKEDPNDKVAAVMLQSCRENVDRPTTGWERDSARIDVSINFTND